MTTFSHTSIFSNGLARLRNYASESQRGSTLTGYSLIIATFVVVSLSAIASLQSNSDDFLTSTGSEIGTPRLPRDQVATSLLPPPPVYAAPTLPPGILTYDDEYMNVVALGGCLDVAAGNVLSFDPTLPCGTNPTNAKLTAHSNNAAELTLKTGGQCLTASGATVVLAPCTGGANQQWWQIDGALPNGVIYQVAGSSPATCIGITTPPPVAGDPAFEMKACGNGAELEILL